VPRQNQALKIVLSPRSKRILVSQMKIFQESLYFIIFHVKQIAELAACSSGNGSKATVIHHSSQKAYMH
jgi:hypothetical protein